MFSRKTFPSREIIACNWMDNYFINYIPSFIVHITNYNRKVLKANCVKIYYIEDMNVEVTNCIKLVLFFRILFYFFLVAVGYLGYP